MVVIRVMELKEQTISFLKKMKRSCDKDIKVIKEKGLDNENFLPASYYKDVLKSLENLRERVLEGYFDESELSCQKVYNYFDILSKEVELIDSSWQGRESEIYFAEKLSWFHHTLSETEKVLSKIKKGEISVG